MRNNLALYETLNLETYVWSNRVVLCGTIGMKNDQDRGLAAEDILAVRALRKRLFPSDIFDEHAWSMLLILFVGYVKNEIISEQALMTRAEVSTASGSRWMAHLVEEGQIEPRQTNDVVALSNDALTNLRTFLDESCNIIGDGK